MRRKSIDIETSKGYVSLKQLPSNACYKALKVVRCGPLLIVQGKTGTLYSESIIYGRTYKKGHHGNYREFIRCLVLLGLWKKEEYEAEIAWYVQGAKNNQRESASKCFLRDAEYLGIELSEEQKKTLLGEE